MDVKAYSARWMRPGEFFNADAAVGPRGDGGSLLNAQKNVTLAKFRDRPQALLESLLLSAADLFGGRGERVRVHGGDEYSGRLGVDGWDLAERPRAK